MKKRTVQIIYMLVVAVYTALSISGIWDYRISIFFLALWNFCWITGFWSIEGYE